jgi:hypothetical protein
VRFTIINKSSRQDEKSNEREVKKIKRHLDKREKGGGKPKTRKRTFKHCTSTG